MSRVDVEGVGNLGGQGLEPAETGIEALTEREVAQSLRCSVAALRRMRRERRGPRWTRVGRLVRYPLTWLREYLQENAGERSDGCGARQRATPTVPGQATPASSTLGCVSEDTPTVSIETVEARNSTQPVWHGRRAR